MPEPAEVAALRRRVLLGTWLAVTVAFATAMLAATGGHVAPQSADLYVVAQYARALAEGHPFQYQPGEPLSTGATSLLHTALLGLTWRLGLRGEALIAAAVSLGALMHLAAILAAARLGLRLAGARRAWWPACCWPSGVRWPGASSTAPDTAPALLLSLLLFEQALRLQAGAPARAASRWRARCWP